MNYILYKQTQLYRFLNYCNECNLEKVVLDCGAGGSYPPLAIFAEHGYKTYGIELNEAQIKKAQSFSKENNLQLDICRGDMRKLPFADESISYIYSYNSIFHMKKNDIRKAINEIKRVLKPDGMSCINFLSLQDEGYGSGEQLGKDEFLQIERDETVIHSYFALEEAEVYFKDMEIIFKENRVLHTMQEDQKIIQGYIDYIIKK